MEILLDDAGDAVGAMLTAPESFSVSEPALPAAEGATAAGEPASVTAAPQL